MSLHFKLKVGAPISYVRIHCLHPHPSSVFTPVFPPVLYQPLNKELLRCSASPAVLLWEQRERDVCVPPPQTHQTLGTGGRRAASPSSYTAVWLCSAAWRDNTLIKVWRSIFTPTVSILDIHYYYYYYYLILTFYLHIWCIVKPAMCSVCQCYSASVLLSFVSTHSWTYFKNTCDY